MNKKDKKLLATARIESAIREAIKDGYIVVVGTDPEGSSFGELNPVGSPMAYGDSKDEFIALGVERNLLTEDVCINKDFDPEEEEDLIDLQQKNEKL